MFTAEDYLQGWIAYSIGGLCLLVFLWFVLRNVAWSAVRHLLIIISACILFTPVTAYPDDAHLAPAFFVSLFEGVMLSGSDAGFQRGLAPIIAVTFFALLGYVILRLLWGRLSKKSPRKQATKKKPRGAQFVEKPDAASEADEPSSLENTAQ